MKIDNFVFNPQRITVKAGDTVTWINHDDIPHTVAAKALAFKSKVHGHRRQVLVHIRDTGQLPLLLLLASAYDGHDRGRGDSDRGRRRHNDAFPAGQPGLQ